MSRVKLSFDWLVIHCQVTFEGYSEYSLELCIFHSYTFNEMITE